MRYFRNLLLIIVLVFIIVSYIIIIEIRKPLQLINNEVSPPFKSVSQLLDCSENAVLTKFRRLSRVTLYNNSEFIRIEEAGLTREILESASSAYINEINSKNSKKSFQANKSKVSTTIPIIFIGGSPRSGTTLIRSMFDAHPNVSCGAETRIIPRFISLSKYLYRNNLEAEKLGKPCIASDVLDAASRAYVYEIIKRQSYNSVLCTKDPTDLFYTEYLSRLFPEAKFILMVRDARAIIYSIAYTGINTAGYSKKSVNDYVGNLENWNKIYQDMYNQCLKVGADRCMLVHYEKLVLKPEKEMRNIFNFLKIEWNHAVLNHEKYIGSKIKLSKTEKSTDQVIKPINLIGLTQWFGRIPNSFLDKIDTIAPMMRIFGYDTKSKNPNYGEPDGKVANNSLLILQNKDYWAEKARNYSDLEMLINRRKL